MLHVINHPIIKVKLSRMRNRDTDSKAFRSNLVELSELMAYEVTKNYHNVSFPIKTPLASTVGYKMKENIVLVPILRAGLGMVDGFKSIIPQAPIGFIGLYRNEKTLQPVEYYCKMPESIYGANIIVLDPMLATGHSAARAISILKQYRPKTIKLASIVSVKQGIDEVLKIHKDVEIYVASVDQKLNKNGYIVPGLGDAGDRIFGTK
ncbi:MAG: uracil phosphoribosyltransferase [Mycoplasmataceae bacterium]|jgi:uracil phosphoribosyltransferase|nr:uracil phosphoribosyltransferase [Mycoplasmataceae bacterium]